MEIYTVNKTGGSTVSTKKRGGLLTAWTDAQKLAGWIPIAEA